MTDYSWAEQTLTALMYNHVLMPYGETGHRFSGMILATETGAFIWEHIEEVNSPQEMAVLMVEEYEVSYEEALADATVVFDNFKKAGWIE